MFRAGFASIGVTPTTYNSVTGVTSSQPGELRILNVVGSPVMIIREMMALRALAMIIYFKFLILDSYVGWTS
jgi:hypothetical protein